MRQPVQKDKTLPVCMLVHQDYYLDGRVMQYTQVLAEQGFAVDVLCSRLENPPPEKGQAGVNVYPISVSHGQSGAAAVLLEYLAAALVYGVMLTLLFLRRRYRVIHVHNMPDFLVFAAIIPRLLGAKIVLDIHDPMPEFFLSKFAGKRGLVYRLLCLEEKVSAAFAHAVITANPLFKQNLIQRGIPAQKISVIANYPDPKIFVRRDRRPEEGTSRARYCLVYPGTLAPRYGLDIPIRALPALRRAIPGVCVRLIGPHCAHADELRALAEALGVQDSLEIFPAIPIDRVPEVLADADVGIYTARPDAHMDIAIPGKVIEYAVMGLPIVTARLTILEALFPDDAVSYFPPGDTDAFTACVIALYKSPRKREEQVHKTDAALAAGHSWEKEQNLYLLLLEKIRST